MFQHIQESWIGQETPLRTMDLVDANAAAATLNAAKSASASSALSELSRLVVEKCRLESTSCSEIRADELAAYLSKVISSERLYVDHRFRELSIDEPRARELLALSAKGQRLSNGDHHWLNRYLMNQSFLEADQGPLLHACDIRFDVVIVSDAGKEFYISRQTKGGGLVGTALRSSDILMDRVWKLEVDHFASENDFLFVPISQSVALDEDPKALHPELQRQVAVVRTDLDCFSDLEISGLVRHGYGLMRKACRTRPDLFGEDLPDGQPWDPTAISAQKRNRSEKEASSVTEQTRRLQAS